MRMLTGLSMLAATLLLAPFVTAADQVAGGENPEQVQEQLNGEWKIVSGVNQGKKLGKEKLAGSLLMIKDKTIVVLDPDQKELYKAKFKIDVSKRPYQIDMISDTPGVPKSLGAGIFEMRPEGWRLCYGLPGAERPTKFASPEGSQLMLFSLAKAEKKPSVETPEPLSPDGPAAERIEQTLGHPTQGDR